LRWAWSRPPISARSFSLIARPAESSAARLMRSPLDLAGVQVGGDRHLLARHGLEGEAGSDLGHAAGAVRDTTNWMTTMIRNTTRPASTVPPTTNGPKAWMTPPASA
jgi:hypothetical protein